MVKEKQRKENGDFAVIELSVITLRKKIREQLELKVRPYMQHKGQPRWLWHGLEFTGRAGGMVTVADSNIHLKDGEGVSHYGVISNKFLLLLILEVLEEMEAEI